MLSLTVGAVSMCALPLRMRILATGDINFIKKGGRGTSLQKNLCLNASVVVTARCLFLVNVVETMNFLECDISSAVKK